MKRRPAEGMRPTRRGVLTGAIALGATACQSAQSMSETDDQAELDPPGDDLDALFADLTDQRDRFEPITPKERAPRRERLARILSAANVDALLVEPGTTFRYLSEVSWGRSERLFGLVVCADGSCFWVVPAFEVSRAEKRIATDGPEGPILGWDEHEYAYAPLAAALRERGVERVAVEPQARAFVAERLGEAFGRERVVPGTPIVRSLRGEKDAHELALLRGASELTQRAIAAVAERLEPGTSDYELGAMMRKAQQRLGLTGVWVLPLIGEGAAYPHGSPEGRLLEKGNLVLVDTGGSLHGYQSDTTRTWMFSALPGKEIGNAWDTVRAAQDRAFKAMRPGVPCSEIDRAARTVIADAGYGAGYETFAHRLGHGIGMEGHEEPYLDGGNELALRPGMTFSDEPGIYVPGRFGIRLEDIVVVTEDGADHFGDWQHGPLTPKGA